MAASCEREEQLKEHYRKLAPLYDTFYEVQSRAKADLIRRFLASTLTGNDQLVDVGGGTAQISLMIHADLQMSRPVVCVDPSEEMLAVARRNGAITVRSTAESFLASKPAYPLKIVLMNGCAHHFQDPDFVFAKLAEYMPDDGVCVVTEYPATITLPFFKAAAEAHSHIGHNLESLCTLVETKGLHCRMVSGTEPARMEKSLWYSALRNRLASMLLGFSDEELEQGIEELEEQFEGKDVLNFDIVLDGIIITQKCVFKNMIT